MIFAEEKLKDCLEEIKPLLHEHWLEVANDKEVIKLNPAYDIYLSLEESGILHVVTARNNGELVGYFISMVIPDLHYSDHIFANNDILFLKKEFRNGAFAYKMFSFAEEKLIALGASAIHIRMKTSFPFDALCEKLGYKFVEKVYRKVVGGLYGN